MPDRLLVEQLDQAIESVLAAAPQAETSPLPAEGGDAELAALAGIVGYLRELPAESFKARLKAELERRASLTATTTAGTATTTTGAGESLRGIPHHRAIHRS